MKMQWLFDRCVQSVLMLIIVSRHAPSSASGKSESLRHYGCTPAISGLHYYSCNANESSRTFFRCMNSSEVIDEDEVCDCKQDCPDLTDELFCPSIYYSACSPMNGSFGENREQFKIQKICNETETTVCRFVTNSEYSSDSLCDQIKDIVNISDVERDLKTKYERMYNLSQKSLRDADNPSCSVCSQRCGTQFKRYAFLERYRTLIAVGILIGISAAIGNLAVMVVIINKLSRKWEHLCAEKRITKIYFLSLSVSDLFVAISTIASAMLLESTRTSEDNSYYNQWVISCNAIGSLSAIGSEQSVFTMLLITVTRLFGMARPFSRIPAKLFLLLLLAAWLIAVLLATVPLMEYFQETFVMSILQDEAPVLKKIHVGQVKELNNMLQSFSRSTEYLEINEGWSRLQHFMKKLFNITTTYPYGYYHNLELCVPNIFPEQATRSKYYTLMMFILNAVCFVMMAVGYLFIYKFSQQSPSPLAGAKIESRRLKKKIICVLATDFLCWMPLCILGIIHILHTDINGEGLIDTRKATLFALLLVLPINSAVNPFIYSAAPEYLQQKIKVCIKLSMDRNASGKHGHAAPGRLRDMNNAALNHLELSPTNHDSTTNS